jgi:hypothetical protein
MEPIMTTNMTCRMANKICMIITSCMMLMVIGCTYDSMDQSTAEQQTFEQRRAAAQNDPMNYKIPDDADTGDISGGGINNYDKNAMKRDMNDVLNP